MIIMTTCAQFRSLLQIQFMCVFNLYYNKTNLISRCNEWLWRTFRIGLIRKTWFPLHHKTRPAASTIFFSTHWSTGSCFLGVRPLNLVLVLRTRGDMQPLHHEYCWCSAYSSTGKTLALSFTWQEVHMGKIFKRKRRKKERRRRTFNYCDYLRAFMLRAIIIFQRWNKIMSGTNWKLIARWNPWHNAWQCWIRTYIKSD